MSEVKLDKNGHVHRGGVPGMPQTRTPEALAKRRLAFASKRLHRRCKAKYCNILLPLENLGGLCDEHFKAKKNSAQRQEYSEGRGHKARQQARKLEKMLEALTYYRDHPPLPPGKHNNPKRYGSTGSCPWFTQLPEDLQAKARAYYNAKLIECLSLGKANTHSLRGGCAGYACKRVRLEAKGIDFSEDWRSNVCGRKRRLRIWRTKAIKFMMSGGVIPGWTGDVPPIPYPNIRVGFPEGYRQPLPSEEACNG